MCLLRLFDDADTYDQERIETLPLLCLHEGPEAWLEELQVEVRAGCRDREVRRRQNTPRWPRRGARRRGGGTSQDPIRARTRALVAERDELVKELEYWNEAIRVAAPRLSQARQIQLP